MRNLNRSSRTYVVILLLTLAPSPAGAWSFETGWYGAASTQQVNALVPGKLSTLAESDIHRETQSVPDGHFLAPGGAISIGGAFAFGGQRTLVGGEQVPVIRASATTAHVGPDNRDGFSRTSAGFNLFDTIGVKSSVLPLGAEVNLPFTLLLNGTLSPPGAPLGGDLFYIKRNGGFADTSIATSLQIISRDAPITTLLNLSITRKMFDGPTCQPGALCSVILSDPLPGPGATEECYPSGCFAVAPPSSPRVGTFLMRGSVRAHVGERFDLFASGGAEAFSESPRFGNMSAEMSNSAYFGVTELPDGVSLESELGYGYRLDPLKVAAVPEPATALLMSLGVLTLAAAGRRERNARRRRA
jgi:hypothetical protein